MANNNGTYSVYPEGVTPTPVSQSSDQLIETVYMIALKLEKSEKKRKKLERKIDKMFKQGKKSKKPKGKNKSKGKKGKGKNKRPDWKDDFMRESTATGLKLAEMYAESRLFPDGRGKPK